MFLWHSPLVILWENAWKMPRSHARENYRKRSGEQAIHWYFPGAG